MPAVRHVVFSQAVVAQHGHPDIRLVVPAKQLAAQFVDVGCCAMTYPLVNSSMTEQFLSTLSITTSLTASPLQMAAELAPNHGLDERALMGAIVTY